MLRELFIKTGKLTVVKRNIDIVKDGVNVLDEEVDPKTIFLARESDLEDLETAIHNSRWSEYRIHAEDANTGDDFFRITTPARTIRCLPQSVVPNYIRFIGEYFGSQVHRMSRSVLVLDGIFNGLGLVPLKQNPFSREKRLLIMQQCMGMRLMGFRCPIVVISYDPSLDDIPLEDKKSADLMKLFGIEQMVKFAHNQNQGRVWVKFIKKQRYTSKYMLPGINFIPETESFVESVKNMLEGDERLVVIAPTDHLTWRVLDVLANEEDYKDVTFIRGTKSWIGCVNIIMHLITSGDKLMIAILGHEDFEDVRVHGIYDIYQDESRIIAFRDILNGIARLHRVNIFVLDVKRLPKHDWNNRLTVDNAWRMEHQKYK